MSQVFLWLQQKMTSFEFPPYQTGLCGSNSVVAGWEIRNSTSSPCLEWEASCTILELQSLIGSAPPIVSASRLFTWRLISTLSAKSQE